MFIRLRTTELKVFNENYLIMWIYIACGSSVGSLLNSSCLVLLRKKTAKTPCIIALKLSLKRLSANLYKCQIPFIKNIPSQCIRCVLVSKKRRIFKYIIVQYVTANSPLRRIKNILVKRKLPPAIRLTSRLAPLL